MCITLIEIDLEIDYQMNYDDIKCLNEKFSF